MRSDYKICPICGAALDIGERCNCCECKENTPGYKSPLEIYDQGSRYTPGKSTPLVIPGATRAAKEGASILLQA